MKKLIRIASLMLLTAIWLAPMAQAQKWKSDPVHCGLHFMVRHMVTPMMGEFNEFTVDMVWDEEDLSKCSIDATIDVNSVEMGGPKLEKHLKAEDFFHAEKYPEWKFTSQNIKKTPAGYVAFGNITLRGVTRPLEIPFQMTGTMDSPMGRKAGFMTQILLNRFDYDIKYNPEADLLGKDVQVSIYLEMNPAE